MPLPLPKILGLTFTAVAHYYSITPPLPPPKKEEKVFNKHHFESVLPFLRFGTMATLILSLLSEIVVISASAYSDVALASPNLSVYQTLCPRPSSNFASLQSFTALFAVGLFLAVAGCAIRVWCYNVLGNLFTYEVTVRPAHQLVQCPPYNIVRHPSYTGLFMHFVGIVIIEFSPGAWYQECGILHTIPGKWAYVWITLIMYTFVSVWRRGATEDEIMRQRFGAVWEQYHSNVPCKFFPWLI